MKRRDFEQSVLEYMKKKNMCRPGDGILLAVSGGADSVALLRLFAERRSELDIRLRCVHVEHGLRGEESLGDAAFVQALCQRLEVPFEMISVGEQIAAMANTHQSLEEKARIARYEALEAQADLAQKEWKCSVEVALAHHAGDNAETMLYHLIRGTGLDGMVGMPTVRGRFIRPFLQVEKKEIEDYLEELEQDYRTDSTNLERRYARNRLRLDVLPVLTQINEQAVPHLCEAGELIEQVADYINGQARAGLKISGDGKILYADSLAGEPEFMQKEMLHLWLQGLIPGAKDIGAVHIASLLKLLDKQVGKQVDLPCDIAIRRCYEGLVAVSKTSGEKEHYCKEILLDELGAETMSVLHNATKILFCVRERQREDVIDQNSCKKWFDYDMIKNNIQLRTRQTGDYLTVNALGQKKKLKEYFINEKIPAAERDNILLLCDHSHVIWVLGHRISEYYKVTEATKRILEVQIFEEKENE